MRIDRHLGELAAAHRLPHHGGMCALLHGHNWDVHAWVEAPVDPATGIAVDFLDFDAFWKAAMQELDHAVWLAREDPLAGTLQAAGVEMKLVLVDGDPTAENMAVVLLGRLRGAFPRGSRWGVRVSEMAGCSAEVVAEE